MMFDRIRLGTLMFICLALPFAGCGSSNEIDSITVSPTTLTFGAAGLTAQLTATATIGHGSHPATTEDVTNLATWTSGATDVATVSSTGLVTSVGPGSIQITASIAGFTGPVTASSQVTVSTTSTGPTNTDVTSISIIPGTQTVQVPGDTAQFVAIGTTASGTTENVTSLVSWSSSSAQIASITSTGLATAVDQGTATITAIFTNPDKSVATSTATFTVSTGAAQQVTSLTVYPGSQAATSQTQQTQFFVLGLEGDGLLYDVTNQVVWSSSNTAVGTIGTAGNGTPGLATSVGTGSATFTAVYTNKNGSEVVGTASYTVTIGAAQEPLISINIVPGGVTVSNKGMTGQFLAFGTYSTTPTVRDLTNTTNWISLTPEVVSINSGGTSGEQAGLATAMGYTGSGVIYAESTNPDGTVVLSNPETFICKDSVTNVCDQEVATPQFATVTFFNAGENDTTWLVTAPSDTGTPDLIHCGPGWTGTGGSVCTGTYAVGTTVTLTASPTGSGFGGWSNGDGVSGGVGCQPATGTTLLNSPTCTLTLSGNTSVGAIFY